MWKQSQDWKVESHWRLWRSVILMAKISKIVNYELNSKEDFQVILINIKIFEMRKKYPTPPTLDSGSSILTLPITGSGCPPIPSKLFDFSWYSSYKHLYFIVKIYILFPLFPTPNPIPYDKKRFLRFWYNCPENSTPNQ